MSTELRLRTPERAVHEVARMLPEPSETNYQAPYPNKLELIGAMTMLPTIEGVATPEEIRNQRVIDAAIATGELAAPKITVGNCSELLVSDFDIAMIEAIANGEITMDELELPSLAEAVDGYIAMEDVAIDVLGPETSLELRAAAQSFKPRSSFTQTLQDGRIVHSYFGDGVNSRDENQRIPDPRRLVAVRAQSLKLKQCMQARGRSPIFAHEALSLPYEHMATYKDNGDRVILSGHRLWIGDRTSDPDGPHVALLRHAINPMGIKLGPRTDRARVRRIVEGLNITEPGSVSFMIRIDRNRPGKLEEVASALAEYAPSQLYQHDVHDDTEQVSYQGKTLKVRSVENTTDNIAATHRALAAVGLQLHGLHVEVKGTDSNPECVDRRGQIPENKTPVVDPLFTLRQWQAILVTAREYLPQAA